METKAMVCIICPVGCEITAEYDGDNDKITVTGNKCTRGEKYASEEVKNPRRTLTSVIPVENETLMFLPVKTDSPILRENLNAAMELLNTLKISAPIKMGDIVYSDFIEKGVNLTACRDIEVRKI